MTSGALNQSNLPGLELLGRGKVRDLYALGEDLLLVATDRISAFDVVMEEAIPDKGKVLTTVAGFWFKLLAPLCPHHLLSLDVDEWSDLPPETASTLRHRTMRVRRVDPLPVEFVVRGYLTGSGWKEYQEKGSVCGVSLPAGLKHAQRLPEPILTPTTKAHEGHDMPMTFAEVEELIGGDLARQTREVSINLFNKATIYAEKRKFVIADTKLEFGTSKGQLYVIDEAFTPDSSRFWPADMVSPGAKPPSFDKQVLRDWLNQTGWDHSPPPPALPENVVQGTAEKYREICIRLTGLTYEGVPASKNA